MRLNRFLSLCGLGSRRGVEDLVLQGRVTVNGNVVKELGTQIGDEDEVSVDAKPVRTAKPVVVVLNKPKGYLCTREDTHNRATIYDLLPARYQNLHHVGRLDMDSEGLILLTNRGDLSQRLLHPSEGVEKEYEVRLEKQFKSSDIPKLLTGVHTTEGFAKAERVYVDSVWKVNVVLKQGLKRQIRLMFYEIGYEVERLVRTRIGGLKIFGMTKATWRELTEAEVQRYFLDPRRSTNKEKGKPGAEEDGDDLAPRRSVLKSKRPMERPKPAEVRARIEGSRDEAPKPAAKTKAPSRALVREPGQNKFAPPAGSARDYFDTPEERPAGKSRSTGAGARAGRSKYAKSKDDGDDFEKKPRGPRGVGNPRPPSGRGAGKFSKPRDGGDDFEKKPRGPRGPGNPRSASGSGGGPSKFKRSEGAGATGGARERFQSKKQQGRPAGPRSAGPKLGSKGPPRAGGKGPSGKRRV